MTHNSGIINNPALTPNGHMRRVSLFQDGQRRASNIMYSSWSSISSVEPLSPSQKRASTPPPSSDVKRQAIQTSFQKTAANLGNRIRGIGSSKAGAQARRSSDKIEQELDEISLLKSNRRILCISNHFCSLETLFGYFFVDKRLHYALDSFKLLYFVAGIVRHTLALVFSCDQNGWYHWLVDWTVYYPPGRRTGLLHAFICFALLQITIRRSLLMYSKFSPALVEFICKRPPPASCCSSATKSLYGCRCSANKKQQQKQQQAEDYQEHNKLQLEFADQVLANAAHHQHQQQINLSALNQKRKRSQSMGAPLHGSASIGSINQRLRRTVQILVARDQLRDRTHWFRLSLHARQLQRKILLLWMPFASVIMLFSAIRLAFLLVPKHDCYPINPMLRFVGVIELVYCLCEGLMTIASFIFYSSLVGRDLQLQADKIDAKLKHLIQQYDVYTELNNRRNLISVTALPGRQSISGGGGFDSREDRYPSRQDSLLRRRRDTQKKRQFPRLRRGHHNETKGTLLDDAPYEQDDYFNFLSPLPPFVGQVSRAGGRASLVELRSLALPHPTTPPPSQMSHNLGRTFSLQQAALVGLGEQQQLSLLGAQAERSLTDSGARTPLLELLPPTSHQQLDSASADEQTEQTGLIGTQNFDSLNLIDRLMLDLVDTQRQVVVFLRCIDSHKPAISFIANGQYIHMVTAVTFFILVMIEGRQEKRETFGLAIYVYLALHGLISGMVFTGICARVNQRAIELGKKLFILCSKHHSRAVVRRWNIIFMIWYCPNRCAFRVAGLFDLTYLNILKTLSFLLSGLTLLLNYAYD